MTLSYEQFFHTINIFRVIDLSNNNLPYMEHSVRRKRTLKDVCIYIYIYNI